MKPVFKPLGCIVCLAFLLSFTACASDEPSITINNGVVETNGVIPEKTDLIENLEDAGYTLTEHTSIEGSDLTIDRIFAEKGNKFIDITFCSTEEEATSLFKAYCDMYEADDDYYILAQNLNYVYCVSDKKTFSTAGFKSTSNIGQQYINN
ncbi:MAG: hypothetical protein J6K04_12965 [Lachnospiraceae bacterium]|nr:hypothetical protein [Lachnospiraceae bacterium]